MKWFYRAFALLLLAVLAGCGPSPESRLTGTWTSSLVTIATVNVKMTMVLNSDGTASMETKTEVGEGDPNSLAGRAMEAFGVNATVKETGTWEVASAEGDKATLSIKSDGKDKALLFEVAFLSDTEIEVTSNQHPGSVFKFTRVAA